MLAGGHVRRSRRQSWTRDVDGYCGPSIVNQRAFKQLSAACFSRVDFLGTKQPVSDDRGWRKRGRDSNTGSNRGEEKIAAQSGSTLVPTHANSRRAARGT